MVYVHSQGLFVITSPVRPNLGLTIQSRPTTMYVIRPPKALKEWNIPSLYPEASMFGLIVLGDLYN